MLCPVISSLGWAQPRPLGLLGCPRLGTVRLSPVLGPCPAWGCPLAFTLPPFLACKCSSFIEGKFLHCVFQIFFVYLHTTAWSNYLFYLDPYPSLFSAWESYTWWKYSRVEKEKYLSLTVSCKRKGCTHTLSPLCLWTKAEKNQVLFWKILLQFSISKLWHHHY